MASMGEIFEAESAGMYAEIRQIKIPKMFANKIILKLILNNASGIRLVWARFLREKEFSICAKKIPIIEPIILPATAIIPLSKRINFFM